MDKDAFLKIIAKLERQIDIDKEWSGAMSMLSPEAPGYDNQALYEATFDLFDLLIPGGGEELRYFCFEIDFGRKWKPGMVTDKGRDIDLSSSAKLYDYLQG